MQKLLEEVPLQRERITFESIKSNQKCLRPANLRLATLPAEEDRMFRNRPPIRRYRAGNLFEKRAFQTPPSA